MYKIGVQSPYKNYQFGRLGVAYIQLYTVWIDVADNLLLRRLIYMQLKPTLHADMV